MDPIRHDKTFQMLQAALDVSTQRHRTIASNIANLDTPGFKARDIDFHEVLDLVAENMELNGFGEELQSRQEVTSVIEPREVPFLTERLDGNSVDIDREMANLTLNAGQYRLAKELLQARLRLLHENLRAAP